MSTHPTSSPSSTWPRWVLAAVLLVFVVMVYVSSRQSGRIEPYRQALDQGASPRRILDLCGPPTSDTTTRDEPPVPFLVTRRLLFTEARVGLLYVNAANYGRSEVWRIVGFMTPGSEHPLDLETAAERLAEHCEGRQ